MVSRKYQACFLFISKRIKLTDLKSIIPLDLFGPYIFALISINVNCDSNLTQKNVTITICKTRNKISQQLQTLVKILFSYYNHEVLASKILIHPTF